jgi:hypothetical protein
VIVDLRERKGCLADLHASLADVPRSGGRVVLVGAEAGLGNTTLVRTFADGQSLARVL